LASGALSRAVGVIRHGGIVAYPTEYCFGLGCDPHDYRAVLRLLRIKQRPPSKGLILIAADISQLEPYVDDIPPPVMDSWPGPHTWLLTPRQGVPYWLTGDHPRVAVRVTAHPAAAALCRAAKMAIVSTSANRSRQHPARSYHEVQRRFGKEVDYVLPGRVGKLPAPTPIRDAVTGAVVRPG
jgi:L-threonylcarbamoyladenylate synthase